MPTPLDKKLGYKKEMRAAVIDAPPEVRALEDFPAGDLKKRLSGSFDFIHVFVDDRKKLDARFPKLKKHLAGTGALWVSWLKGDRRASGLTLREVIRIGYDHGLVESKTISVDARWSAIKFTFPKAGKRYENSYGKLKGEAS